jgi:hypothetical protein
MRYNAASSKTQNFLGGFMRNSNLLGIMSIVMLSACGKGMELIKANPDVVAQKNAIEQSKKMQALIADQTDGKLYPLSAFDMRNLAGHLPFLNADDKGQASPEAVLQIGGATNAEGYVKNSNVVFRAIERVAPAANVTEVSAFSLVLKGVKIYSADGKVDQTVSKQVLCLVDKSVCAGAAPASSDTNANQAFWKNVATSAYPLADAAAFGSALPIETGSVYTYIGVQAPTKTDVNATAATSKAATTESSVPAASATDKVAATTDAIADATTTVVTKDGVDLIIDLKKAFALDDKQVPAWMIDHSSAFDKKGVYRKFQFSLGNNLYVREGQLIYTSKTDQNEPADYRSVMVDLANGSTDVSVFLGSKAPVTVSVKAKTNEDGTVTVQTLFGESVFAYDDQQDLSDEAKAKLQSITDFLAANKNSFASMQIGVRMDKGADATTSLAIAKQRADNVVEVLISQNVLVKPTSKSSIITKNSKCAATAKECANDRVTRITLTTVKALSEKQTAAVTALKKLINDLKGTIESAI